MIDAQFLRQRGSTLTGFIVGLVVGLAIAVGVAMVINKGSTPFTDKSGKLGKAPEPTAGQISDPNKPLYGNNEAAREANRDFQKDPAAPELKLAPGAKTVAVPTDPAKPAAAKTDGAAAPAVPAAGAAAAAPEATAAEQIYYLQTGAFREPAEAESMRAKLALLGMEAAINEIGGLHKVRLGPYAGVEAMNKVRSKLIDNGFQVQVNHNQK